MISIFSSTKKVNVSFKFCTDEGSETCDSSFFYLLLWLYRFSPARAVCASRQRTTCLCDTVLSCSRRRPSMALTQLFFPPNTIFLLFHLISSSERVIPLHPGKPLIIYFCFCRRGMFRKVTAALRRTEPSLWGRSPCLYTVFYLSDCGVRV